MNQSKLSFAKISDFVKAFLIISLISTGILFLLEHEIKYILYIFTVLISGILLLTVFRIQINFNFNLKLFLKFSDYFLILSTIFVFVSNVLGILEPTINFVLTLIVSFFVPGWVLLKILGINLEKEFNFGLLAIIFATSVGLTSIIFLFMLPFKEDASTFIVTVYLAISIIPLLKEKLFNFNKQKNPSIKSTIQRQFNGLDLLLIGILAVFFVSVISILYPQMASFPTDISRHYSDATGLLLTTDIYGSNYPWYHFVLSSIHELSHPQMLLFQTGIAFMSIMVLFSFYIMSKIYLSEFNQRAHIFGTIFFFVFSGFGWIFLISQKFLLPEAGDYFDTLFSSYIASYWDIGLGQGPWLWFWFRPITIGFTIFFLLLYLLKKHSFSRIQYLILTTILMVTLIQVHLPEFLIFVFLLLVVSIVRPKIKLRLKDTAICLIISLALIILFTSYQSLFTSSYHPLGLEKTIALMGISAMILLFVKFPHRPNLSMKIHWKTLTMITLFVYFTFLIYWFYSSDEFSIGTVRTILGVPLEFYPPLLGIVGMLAIPGIFMTLNKYRNNPVIIFVILLISVILIGRLLTFVNAESLFITGYFERRLIPFVYVAASVLAALLVVKFLEKLNIAWNLAYTKKLVFSCIVSLLVIGGISSTFLTIEYHLTNMENSKMTENERKFHSLLQGVDPYSFLLTNTDTTRSFAQYYNLGSNPNHFREQIWTSTNPETTLNAFSTLNSTSIIFLAERDLKQIQKFETGYVSSHLMKIGPRIEKHDGLFVQIPPISSPSSNGEMVLVIPDDKTKYFYAYDILSLGQYNYTTALLSDVSTWKNTKTLVIPTEKLIPEIIDYKERFDISFKKLIVLNLDGFSHFLPVSLISENSLINDNNSTFDKLIQTNVIEDNSGNKLRLPIDLHLNEFSQSLQHLNVTAHYNPDIPFAVNYTMTKNPDEINGDETQSKINNDDIFNIIYLNVFPIIQELNSGNTNSSKLYPILGNLLNFAGNDFPNIDPNIRSKYSFAPVGTIAFNEGVFYGNLEIQSTSGIIHLNSSLVQGTIDNIEFEFNDISKILPINTDKVIIKSIEGKIKNGIGYYTQTILNSSYVNFEGQPTILLFEKNDGNKTIITGNKIEIYLNDSTILMRTPKIISNETAKFENFYSFGTPFNNLQILNKDIIVIGNIEFTTKFSDEFIIATISSLDGDIIQSDLRYEYDELKHLSNIFSLSFFPYLGILLAIFSSASVIIYKKWNNP